MFSILVVIAKLSDKDMVFNNFIDKSMFIINASRPIARKAVFQRLWFTDTFKRVALNILNQSIYPFKHGFIGFLPVQVVFPSSAGKSKIHSINACSVPFPASSSAIDSSRWRAFAGDRSRYAVSSMA